MDELWEVKTDELEEPAVAGQPEELAVTNEQEIPEEEPVMTDEPEIPEGESVMTDEQEIPEEEPVMTGEPDAATGQAGVTEEPTAVKQETVVTKRTEVVERETVVTKQAEVVERETVAAKQAEVVERETVAANAEREAVAANQTGREPVAATQEKPVAEDAPPTEAEKLSKKARRAERAVKEYQFAVLRVLLLLAVLWVLFFKFIGLMRMPSDEMYPRIDAGDMVLYYRLDTDVRAQDVIVIRKSAPDDAEPRMYVLRVVAASGDTVEISDSDRLRINGSTMVESNIFYPTPRYEGFTEYPLTLGEDECFVLADSRSGGSDSRYFGPVRRDEILGTVITIMRRNNL